MMSQDCFKPLKDFDMYEVNSEGSVRKITTKRMLTPRRTHSGDRFELKDSGHRITISRNKLAYCYEHDVSPYELRGKVVSDGVLMTIAEHCSYLHITNIERHYYHKIDEEEEDVIFQYERTIRFLNLLLKFKKQELNDEEGRELNDLMQSMVRKAIVRYYRFEKEYRKEEIEEICRTLFYDTYLAHCPFNIDRHIYKVCKSRLGNKRR